MIKDIYIERNNDGQIIGIGFSQTFCDIMQKHPSVAKEILKKVEFVSHIGMDDGWLCPYCGKKVYSMEVHPCTQPTY